MIDAETKKRIEEARSARAAAIASAKSDASDRRELAQLKLADLGELHGHDKIAPVFTVQGHLVVYQRAEAEAVDRWQDALNRARRIKSKTIAAQDERKATSALVEASRVYPEREVYLEYVANDSGLPLRSSQCVVELIHLADEELEGKSQMPSSEAEAV